MIPVQVRFAQSSVLSGFQTGCMIGLCTSTPVAVSTADASNATPCRASAPLLTINALPYWTHSSSWDQFPLGLREDRKDGQEREGRGAGRRAREDSASQLRGCSLAREAAASRGGGCARGARGKTARRSCSGGGRAREAPQPLAHAERSGRARQSEAPRWQAGDSRPCPQATTSPRPSSQMCRSQI